MKRRSIFAALSALALLTAHAPASAECSASTPMSYYGGKIVAAPRVVNVYWGITGTNLTSLQSVADSVLSSTGDSTFGLAGTRWWNLLTQYSAKADRQTNANAWASNPTDILYPSDVLDNHNVPKAPATSVSESQVGAEVDYLVKNGKIPGMTKDTIVMMYLPPGFSPPMSACGRHLVSPGGNLYAWFTWHDTVAGCTIEWVQQAISHEIVETVLNPEWNVSTEAWDQGTGANCEVGDLCENLSFLVQTETNYQGHGGYSLAQTQPYFSNEAASLVGQGCVYGLSTHAFIFGIGGNSQLYAQSIFPTEQKTIGIQWWQLWGSGNGNTVKFVQKPGAASWGPNRVDAFALDSTGSVWHVANGAGWESLGHPAAGFWTQYPNSSPDAVSWGAGNVQVFAVGSDYTVYRNHLDEGDGGWSGWQQIALAGAGHGLPFSNVTVASAMATNTSGGYPTDVHSVNIAYIDTNNQIELGTIARYSTTPTWRQFGVPFQAFDIDMSIWAPGRIDIFVRDRDGNLWDCVSTDQVNVGSCYSWSHPGDGTFNAIPGVVGLGDGRLFVAGRAGGGGNNAAYFSFWDWTGASAWNGWFEDNQQNGTFIGGLDVASW